MSTKFSGFDITDRQMKKSLFHNLDEVTLMRAILAVLIVFMHSFTCYNHSWPPPESFVEIPLYQWLSRISFAFALEAFVFVSGYLFSFSYYTLKKNDTFLSFCWKKIKRLIIPSIIFSMVYFFLFYQYSGVDVLIYRILNGCGHMWFLPMLFWCSIAGWIIIRINLNDVCKLFLLAFLSMVVPDILPFRIGTAAIFMFYFYGGVVAYKYIDKVNAFVTKRRLIIGWVIFAIVFVVMRPLRDELCSSGSPSSLINVVSLIGGRACRLIYASCGTMVFWSTAVYFVHHNQLSSRATHFSSLCFGIYLFQQFILQLLYYRTCFPKLLGPYWLPWFGFVVTMLFSYIAADLVKKTRFGREIIG